MGIAQLPELRPTRWSPDSRTIKDDDGFSSSAVAMIVNRLAVRIGQDKVRQAFADIRPG